MKKRIVSLLLGVCMVATMLVGCGGSASTDTEQKTESSSNEQGTEQGTEQSTEQEAVTTGKYSYSNCQIYSDSCGYTNVRELFNQYVFGKIPKGDFVPEFNTFLSSEDVVSGKEALSEIIYIYENFATPSYKNGKVVVDSLAYSISYDGETYQLINDGEDFTLSENTTTAILYKVSLVPNYEKYDTITANVIVVLGRENVGDTVHAGTSYVWGKLVGMYSLDSASKYFPDLNLE